MSRSIRSAERRMASMVRRLASPGGPGAQREGRAHEDDAERVPEVVRHDREQVFARLDRPPRLLVEARVVHRHRGAPRDLLREDEVVGAVAPSRRRRRRT